MTPERWQEIERVYREALAVNPRDRTSFLSHAYGEDQQADLCLAPSTAERPHG
jgi:hypothetical protein